MALPRTLAGGLSNTQLTALRPTGKSFDVADPAVPVCTTVVRYHTLMALLLLLVRLGSLAKAKWHEFDFVKKEWSIPAEHDKERRSHIVPLTDWAIEHVTSLGEWLIGGQPRRLRTGHSSP